jgi:murein tripeptide amidase MpaA
MRQHIFTLCLGLLAAAQAHKSYQGYKVLRTETLDSAAAKILNDVQVETTLDFWQDPVPGRQADVMTPPHFMDKLANFLKEHGIKFTIMIDDVEELVQESKPSPKSATPRDGASYDMDWDDYHDHDTLNAFLDALAAANDFADIINIGKSGEGRDMNVLALTKAGAGKPNIWLEAGIHAREWIAPAVCTFIVRELVENYADHPEYLDELNWYILPSANPDGYMYSHEHDRMWRKTRSDHGSILGCKGVDPNRNWGYHFGESGVSHDKCSDVYCGPEAFSEIEMKNIVAFVQTLEPVPVLSHCFHSYSQLWLWPYGYAYNEYPDNWQEIKQLAEDASDALYGVHGTVFDPINSAELYPAAGASDDWYKGVLGSRFAFTTELRDTGRHGFLLPKDQIIPSGEEMWAGFVVVANKMIEVSKEQ